MSYMMIQLGCYILEGTSRNGLWNLLITKGLILLKDCEISLLQHDCMFSYYIYN